MGSSVKKKLAGLGGAALSTFVLIPSRVGAQPYVLQSADVFAPLPAGVGTPVTMLTRSAGDWNGDGWSDLGIAWGANLYVFPAIFRVHSGRDFSVIYELASGWISTPGQTQFERFNALGFGDVNGEGIPDVVLGNPDASPGGVAFSGRVEVRSAPTGQLIYELAGAQVGDALGHQVEVVGDVTGDGAADFLALAPGVATSGGPNAGAVYLFEGAYGGVLQAYYGSAAEFYAQSSRFAGLGDIDIDGVPDFAITRVFNAVAGYGVPGRVTIYSGANPAQVIREHVAWPSGEGFCYAGLFSTGDGDGDGVPEYVIGNSLYPVGSVLFPSPGRAWLYSGATGMVLVAYFPPPGVWRVGERGGALEDLDGDGYPEVLLSASGYNSGWNPPGNPSILIYAGGSGTVIQSLTNPYGLDFGNRLTTINDGKLSFTEGVSAGYLLRYDRSFVSVSPNPVPVGGTATFDFNLPTEPSGVFHLYFSASTAQGIQLGSRRFALDADPLFWTSAQVVAFDGVLDLAGTAAISIPVPNDPALSGVSVFYAAVTLDATFPYGARSIGTARAVTIQ